MKIGRCYFDNFVGGGLVYIPLYEITNGVFATLRHDPQNVFFTAQGMRYGEDRDIAPALGYIFLDSKLIKISL